MNLKKAWTITISEKNSTIAYECMHVMAENYMEAGETALGLLENVNDDLKKELGLYITKVSCCCIFKNSSQKNT